MSAPEQTFPASARARRAISRNAYLLFGAAALLLICGAVAAAVSLAAAQDNRTPVLVLAGGLLCVGGAGLLGAIAMLTRLRQPIEVTVSPHRLVWREGSRTATTNFEDVVRVEMVKDREQRRDVVLVFPVVRFIENDDEMVEFEVEFEDRGYIRHARFDARGITRAALPHLPQHAVVAPAVREFVQTGEVDLDLLPER